MTDDDGRMTPLKGEYEEEDGDDESRHAAREDWWEAAAYGEAEIGGHEEKTQEGSSTLVRETSAVRPLWRHKTEEKEGGGEGTKATIDKGAGKNERDITKDVRGQAGQQGVPRGETETSEVAEDTEAESTDTDVGVAKYLFKRVHGAE